MKELIKKAGFKTQRELAKHLKMEEHAIGRQVKKPSTLFRKYIELRIKCLKYFKSLNDNLE